MVHFHHGALRVLRDIVTGLPYFSTEHADMCKGCSLGKYTKKSFSSIDSRLVGILDLIHFDLCGDMSFVSLCGYDYYVTFNDDFSRRTYIFFMKPRGQVLKRFQEFKYLMVSMPPMTSMILGREKALKESG